MYNKSQKLISLEKCYLSWMIDKLDEICKFKVIGLKKLSGYENENFLVETDSGKYVLKKYIYSKHLFDQIEAEIEVLLYLKERAISSVPTPMPFEDGTLIKTIDQDGEQYIWRLLTYLEGEFIKDEIPTIVLYRSLGRYVAQLDLNLQAHDSSVIREREDLWNLLYFPKNEKYNKYIENENDRDIIKQVFVLYQQYVEPILPYLSKTLIHNDANDWNVMVKDGRVSAIIDFGDLAYCPNICELAITIAYACFDKDDPISWALPILSGYHQVIPVSEVELTILYYLIVSRLCTTICNSAYSRHQFPENTYANTSENQAWESLRKLLASGPTKAQRAFRAALDY